MKLSIHSSFSWNLWNLLGLLESIFFSKWIVTRKLSWDLFGFCFWRHNFSWRRRRNIFFGWLGYLNIVLYIRLLLGLILIDNFFLIMFVSFFSNFISLIKVLVHSVLINFFSIFMVLFLINLFLVIFDHQILEILSIIIWWNLLLSMKRLLLLIVLTQIFCIFLLI